MKKYLVSLIAIIILVSVFVKCSAEEKDYLELSDRAGIYTGTIQTGSVPVRFVITSNYDDTGKIDVDINNGVTTDTLNQTEYQMDQENTTFNFTFPTIGLVTVVFDSPREATGAIASFTYSGNPVTVTLTKIY